MTLTPEDLIRIRGEEADVVALTDLVASIDDAHLFLVQAITALTTAGRELDGAAVTAEGLGKDDAQGNLNRLNATVTAIRHLTIIALEDLENLDY